MGCSQPFLTAMVDEERTEKPGKQCIAVYKLGARWCIEHYMSSYSYTVSTL